MFMVICEHAKAILEFADGSRIAVNEIGPGDQGSERFVFIVPFPPMLPHHGSYTVLAGTPYAHQPGNDESDHPWPPN
jgi:hypothetical protein